MGTLEQATSEVTAHRDSFADRIEGAQDLAAGDIGPAAQESSRNWASAMERRQQLCDQWLEATRRLLADGFPTNPLPVVTPEIAGAVAEQRRTVNLAAGFYASPQAARVAATLGQPTRK